MDHLDDGDTILCIAAEKYQSLSKSTVEDEQMPQKECKDQRDSLPQHSLSYPYDKIILNNTSGSIGYPFATSGERCMLSYLSYISQPYLPKDGFTSNPHPPKDGTTHSRLSYTNYPPQDMPTGKSNGISPATQVASSQLAGFIYACYVVKCITEEEDSCGTVPEALAVSGCVGSICRVRIQ
ncbi:sodium/potassium-transporting ATPase subunit beta-1-interacting protein 2 isoform 2 [Cricetulus griseus]|nr:sodium/potassium-transporting ATPase subunit beta-1-interacting protein 2 isoform 2 [Cricetulus griseus]